MFCQCEHVRHENSDHWDIRQPTIPVRTIYGTFQLCKECDEGDCYPKEYREVPRTTGDIWRELCQVNDNISKMEEELRLAKKRRYRLHKEHMRRMHETYQEDK